MKIKLDHDELTPIIIEHLRKKFPNHDVNEIGLYVDADQEIAFEAEAKEPEKSNPNASGTAQ